jgi:serine/threonine protein kinase
MTPERWQQIEQLYHAALERAETERAAFLTRVCAGDETLRREVEVLLAANEQADTFLNERALEREAVKLVGARPVVRAGERINRYQIISHLGAGGMGEVWLAEDTSLGRRVAVKLLPAAFSSDAERVRRFEREARAAGMLNHPNILTVHDAGTHNGAPYIVAELLEGEELRAQLAHGALPLRRALDNAQQLARGLAAAHEKGIVHRDLKPENLFITKDGRLKILDFGLAKLQTPDLLHARPVAADGETSAPSIHTNPGAVLGTVGYMSPEQVRGEEADPRSDIFSFGTILYEMLSGRRAFGGGSVAEMLSAILKEEPPELGTTDSHVPPQLERIVRRCLEKQEQQRFHSAHDLSFALESLSTHSDPGAGTSDVKPVASAPASRPRLLNQVRT